MRALMLSAFHNSGRCSKVSPMSLLCPRTSTGNNVRRAGSNFLPRLCFRLGLQHGRAPDIVHSFFARCESLSVLGEWRSMTMALSGQQMTLPVSVDVYSVRVSAILHGSLLGSGR